MVKQFTIPCDFQGQMAPVTLYIGHPEAAHHPINFQSQWLSSARGGQVPQDLMDTLQKLHDLALENNADFEELCYYALISATNNSSGNGVNPDDINKYADDFVKKEASGVKPNMPTDNNASEQDGAPATPDVSATPNENVDANGNVITKSTPQEEQKDTETNETQTENTAQMQSNTQQEEQIESNTTNTQQEAQQQAEEIKEEQEPQKVMPTINTTPATQATPNENNNTDNTTNSNELMEEPISNISQQTKDIVNDAISSTYSQDDEDLLLMDDMETIDNIINNTSSQSTQSSNQQIPQDNNIKEAEQINDNNDNNGSVYDDEDADLLG